MSQCSATELPDDMQPKEFTQFLVSALPDVIQLVKVLNEHLNFY